MENKWIWPFELMDKLGEGGMGVVYRARYVKNDKLFAVKLLPENISDSTVSGRFERELEILKKLQHPNIVRCFGGVAEGDRQFYAMEIIDGGTLEDVLREQGAMLWGEVIKLAIPMCAGLEYAHKHGVIHRDVKPANFLLTKEGIPKLADFGLATVAAASNLTKVGKTVGTIRYMAPEQITGKQLSPQTDLYSLGCVLYELLTGQHVFEGDSPAEIMHAHLKNEPPRVSSLVPNCPPDLDDLIDHLLEKKSGDRPKSALEVAMRFQRMSEISHLGSTSPIPYRAAETAAPRRKASDSASTAPVVSPTSQVPKWIIPFGLLLIFLLLVQVNQAWLKNSAQMEGYQNLITRYKAEQNPYFRIALLYALGETGTVDKNAVEVLSTALNDPDDHIKTAAVEALGKTGMNGRSMLPVLLKLSKSGSNSQLRMAAAQSHAKLGDVKANSISYSYSIPILIIILMGCWLKTIGALQFPNLKKTSPTKQKEATTERHIYHKPFDSSPRMRRSHSRH